MAGPGFKPGFFGMNSFSTTTAYHSSKVNNSKANLVADNESKCHKLQPGLSASPISICDCDNHTKTYHCCLVCSTIAALFMLVEFNFIHI